LRKWLTGIAVAGLLGLGVLGGYSTKADSATDPVIVAAGDICKGTATNCAPTANLIGAINPVWALALGDNAYEQGSLAQYNSFFAPNWGRYKAIIKPVIGNHEYLTTNGQGYKDYFGPAFAKTYYSYDVGSWHILALDSNCSKVGGCGTGSPQDTFIKNDLATHPATCTLAYWHHPRWSSGTHGSDTLTDPLWKTLYARGVDVILNGHEHIYERFNKQNPAGAADANGMRQFTVGTGGANHTSIGTVRPNSAVRNDKTFGVLKLTLHATSYDWVFTPVAGATFTDTGTDTCSGGTTPPPTTTVGTTTAPPPTTTVVTTPPPTTTTTTTPPPPTSNVTLPARATFFYPWFPESWKQQGFDPFTMYHPTDGFYDSSNPAQIEKQVRAMEYGKFNVAISSWWGQGHPTDQRLPLLLDETEELASPLKWATYYEKESTTNPTPAQITADLTYIRDRYAHESSYATINGKFVVFVFAAGEDTCGMVDRWKQGNTVGAYVVLKVFSGYRNCSNQPDSWHQYAPAVAASSQTGYAYYISPGFNKPGEAGPRLARDLTRFKQNIRDMNAFNAPWKLVTTFNEWGEGSSVESATEWSSPSGFGQYLDALHNDGL
jgi:hypothetical protein